MSEDQSNTERLLRLLAEHQQELYRYVFSFLLHEEDTRDVLQETYVALTRKFSEYDSTKPFLAWAFGFAYLQTLKHRQQSERTRRRLSDDVLELLANERAGEAVSLNSRLQALDDCLEQLSEEDRRLISHRYLTRTTAEQLTEIVGASRRTMFRNLERVRRLLHDCISRRMEESAS